LRCASGHWWSAAARAKRLGRGIGAEQAGEREGGRNSLLLNEVVEASRRVASSGGRLEKIDHLADLLRRAGVDEIRVVVAYLSGVARQGRIGIGWATLQRVVRQVGPATSPAIQLMDVDRALEETARQAGAGSVARREDLLGRLFGRATEAEQQFLLRLIGGELRQGALEGIMLDAIARAAAIPAPEVRRAYMIAGDLGDVAAAALERGAGGLREFGVVLFRPLQPMLAGSVDGVQEALARLGQAALEYKLDGARVQVHKAGADVRIFTRGLNEVTGRLPELVGAVAALPARELVLDGEAIALAADGRPRTFQETMRRFGSRLDPDRMRAELPLSPFFFDLLYMDGETWLHREAQERALALEAIVSPGQRVRRQVTDSPAVAAEFLMAARRAGHEGLLAKALNAPYEAGRRGNGWLKVKPAHTLDLVVLAAEWGHGRRQGWLSNLHLGARDPLTGGFVMLGKTFKGLTDDLLRWQTSALLALETHRDRHVLYVRPAMVVEVAFDGVQASTRYPGGVALRFARVKRYRSDKDAAHADTIEMVKQLV
jgi:DNA ligase-1